MAARRRRRWAAFFAAPVGLEGADPVWPTRYRVAAPGAAVIAAAGVAAAELWKLKTGRQQQVRVEKNAAAAAMRGSRYLKINGTWQDHLLFALLADECGDAGVRRT